VSGEVRYYSVEEAARAMRLTPERVREMLEAGEIEGIPTAGGERWMIPIRGDVRVPPLAGMPPAPPRMEPTTEPVTGATETADKPPPEPPTARTERMEPPDVSAEGPDTSPATTVPARQADENPRGDDAAIIRDLTSESGWVTTQQAARALGISARTVRWHIERGNLEAKPEGEGVERTWRVSVDSLQALRDSRQSAATSPRSSRGPGIGSDIAAESPGNAIRELADRLVEEARRAEAARVRLELSEKAQSTLEAELAEERRRSKEAERERDELRRELEALKEQRESPVSPGPRETSTEEHGDPQEAREATQRAAETLRVPGAPKTATVGTDRGQPRPSTPTPQKPAQRRPWWRRRLGI
jgi:hypothetical protein